MFNFYTLQETSENQNVFRGIEMKHDFHQLFRKLNI